MVGSTDWTVVKSVQLIRENGDYKLSLIASGKIVKGQFVKVGRSNGIIHQIYPNGEISVFVYNGIKVTNKFCDRDKIKVISRDDFIKYIKKTGCTSFYKYIES